MLHKTPDRLAVILESRKPAQGLRSLRQAVLVFPRGEQQFAGNQVEDVAAAI